MKKTKIFCDLHKTFPSIVVNIENNGEPQLKCIYCLRKNNFKGSSGLSFEEIENSDYDTIIKDWPPLENENLLEELTNAINNEISN